MSESMKEFLNPANNTGSETSAHVTNSLLSEIEACKKHFNEHLPKDSNANLQLAMKRVAMLANHTTQTVANFDCGGGEDKPCPSG